MNTGATVENLVTQALGVAGTFSRLSVAITQSTGTTARPVRLRVNSANAGVLVTVPAATTGIFEDLTGSATTALGDKVCYQITGPHEFLKYFLVAGLCIRFAATTGTASFWCAYESEVGAPFNGNNASTTKYAPLTGYGDNSAGFYTNSEPDATVRVNTSGLFSYLTHCCTTNANTNAATVRFRKNAVDGNQVVTFPAGVTGTFTDTTNTDSVLAGDEINTKTVTGGGTVSCTAGLLGATFASNATDWDLLTGATRTASGGWTATQYLPFAKASLATEVEGQTKMTSACYMHKLVLRVLRGTGTTTLQSRINGANGSLTLSLVGTGTAEDVTHVDAIADGDLVNYYSAGGTNTAVGFYGAAFDTVIPLGGGATARPQVFVCT